MIVFDLDDFSEDNNRLDLLFKLKARIHGFKVTLFTVPGLCSYEFLMSVKILDWIDLVPHGQLHPHPRECENWTYEESVEYLKAIGHHYDIFTHGFKAPGWQISDGMYKALAEREWWVCDQPYNNDRRPKELKAFLSDDPRYVHGHIQNDCGNGLEEKFDYYASLHGEFAFMKDVV